jgi:hypothetical protein
MRWVVLIVALLCGTSQLRADELISGEEYTLTGPANTSFFLIPVDGTATITPATIPPGAVPGPGDQFGYQVSFYVNGGESFGSCAQNSPGPCGNLPSSGYVFFFGEPTVFSVNASGYSYYYNAQTGDYVNDPFPQSAFEISIGLPPGFSIFPGSIAAVPEPSTWIMMIIGFLLMGSSWLRHTHSTAPCRTASVPDPSTMTIDCSHWSSTAKLSYC